MIYRSTARLLIDHIKRLVEDDMKLTVEAFQSIESEIDKDWSTIPKKRGRNNQKFSRIRSNKQTNKRDLVQGNTYLPATASEPKNPLGIHFENDVKIIQNKNYVDDDASYDSPHTDDLTKWNLKDFQNTFTSTPSAAGATLHGQFSFSSMDDDGKIPSFDRTESTLTNPYNCNGFNNNDFHQSFNDVNSSKLPTVEAMYQDLKADLNRILQRFVQDSNKRNEPLFDFPLPSYTSDDASHSLSYGTAHNQTNIFF